MTTFTIHKNQETPRRGNAKFVRKYPVDKLLKDESFDFPLEVSKNVRNSVSAWRKLHPESKYAVGRISNELGRCKCLVPPNRDSAPAVIALTTGNMAVTDIETAMLEAMHGNADFAVYHAIIHTELTRRGVIRQMKQWTAPDGRMYTVDFEGSIYDEDEDEVNAAGQKVAINSPGIAEERAARVKEVYGL